MYDLIIEDFFERNRSKFSFVVDYFFLLVQVFTSLFIIVNSVFEKISMS